MFCGDETTSPIGKMDKYLLNHDIAGLLGSLVYEDFEAVLENHGEVELIFENDNNKRVTATILCPHWNSWSS